MSVFLDVQLSVCKFLL